MSSEATYPVVVEKNLPMRARDGVTLYADVYRPAAIAQLETLALEGAARRPRAASIMPRSSASCR